MVDLEPLDDEDVELAARRSCAATTRRPAPTVAEQLLADWDDRASSSFGKVMPQDYKRVLAAKDAGRGRGRTRRDRDHRDR